MLKNAHKYTHYIFYPLTITHVETDTNKNSKECNNTWHDKQRWKRWWPNGLQAANYLHVVYRQENTDKKRLYWSKIHYPKKKKTFLFHLFFSGTVLVRRFLAILKPREDLVGATGKTRNRFYRNRFQLGALAVEMSADGRLHFIAVTQDEHWVHSFHIRTLRRPHAGHFSCLVSAFLPFLTHSPLLGLPFVCYRVSFLFSSCLLVYNSFFFLFARVASLCTFLSPYLHAQKKIKRFDSPLLPTTKKICHLTDLFGNRSPVWPNFKISRIHSVRTLY